MKSKVYKRLNDLRLLVFPLYLFYELLIRTSFCVVLKTGCSVFPQFRFFSRVHYVLGSPLEVATSILARDPLVYRAFVTFCAFI